MPYITVSDLTAAAPGIAPIDATSKPNLAQVNAMIVSEERDLNATLAHMGVVVPINAIPSPISFSIVRDIATEGGIARVLRAKAYGMANPADNGADAAQKRRDLLLKRLADPDDDLNLTDAQLTETIKGTDTMSGADGLTGRFAHYAPITRNTRF